MSTEDVLSCVAALYDEDGDSASELEQWREALKAEIEQDIEEQVRLKLGFSPPVPLSRGSQWDDTAGGVCVSWAGRSKRSLPRLQAVTPNSQLPPPASPQCTNREEVAISERQAGEERGRTLQKTVSFVGTKKLPSKRKRQETAESVVQPPTVYQYVSTKYGTPVEQLSHLHLERRFRTLLFDSSGGERGPLIHCPVEANICRPTPRHVTGHLTQTAALADQHPSEPAPLSTAHSPLEGTTALCHGGPAAEASGGRGRMVYTSCSNTTVTATSHSAGPQTAHRVRGELMFESRFESGNLDQAVQIGSREYELRLRPDLYSNKHTQWFYFSVEGMQPREQYTFHINNFKKPDSLYNYGMQPLLYSEREAGQSGNGWRRVGNNIRYYHSHGVTNDYTLSWTMEFPHEGDRCYLCYCYPYSYTQLLGYLDELEHCPQRSRYIRREVLCSTLAGNTCPLLTITDFQCSSEELCGRAGVVVSARVHPGETNSSWMMQGLIDYLTSDNTHARSLRSHFVFKLIPMLNPDGVIVGNYRTSLSGVDLNRVYKSPLVDLFPTVHHTKALIASFMQQRKLLLYVDLHGHSRKHNVFMYGCHVPRCDHIQFLNERVIPFLLSQQVPDMFSFQSCKFNVHRCKESTGRVVTWRMGVENSFTMEATFCGSTLQGHNCRQFCERDLLAMGRGLGEAIHLYNRFLTSKSYQQKVQCQLAELIMGEQQGVASKMEREQSTVQPLPDIITSTTQPHRKSSDAKAAATSSKRRKAAKTLQRFMKCSMDSLENESSTSGSDSENDEFHYRIKKQGSVRKKRPSLHHAQTQVHLPRLVRQQPPLSSTTCPSAITTSASTCRLPGVRVLKPSASAPAQLLHVGNSSSTSRERRGRQSGWRFVNRYRDRSNGGIPMFSEERSRERLEKRMQAMSVLEGLEAQATQHSREVLLDKACHSSKPLLDKAHHSSKPLLDKAHHSISTHVLWRPVLVESQEDEKTECRRLEGKGHQRHFKSVKGLVDRHLGNSCQATQATQLGDLVHVLQPGLSKRHRGAPGQTRHLSPTLAKFISEVWSNINNN